MCVVHIQAIKYWKFANAHRVQRAYITQLQLYGDTACVVPISIPAEGGWDDAASACPAGRCNLCSGWHGGHSLCDKGCLLVIDNDVSSSWRPGCGTCPQGPVWMTFRLTENIACIKAGGLGAGTGGGAQWNGGLQVSFSLDGNTWQLLARDDALSGSDQNTFVIQALWPQVYADNTMSTPRAPRNGQSGSQKHS